MVKARFYALSFYDDDVPSRLAYRGKGVVLFSVERLQDPQRKKLALERLRLIKQLVGEGYRVCVPREPEHSDPAFLGKAQKYGAKVLNLELGAANWIRDSYSEFGKKRIMNVKAKQRGRSPRSMLGEGGGVIQVGRNTFLVQQGFVLGNESAILKMRQEGNRIWVLPNPVKQIRNRVPPHIDLVMGVVPHKRILVIDAAYYMQARQVIDALVQQNKLHVIFVPRSEESLFPANFLVLPDKRVLTIASAKKTNTLLRGFGVEIIESASPLRASLANNGGPRCLARNLGKDSPQN